jgi:hypothetical protein
VTTVALAAKAVAHLVATLAKALHAVTWVLPVVSKIARLAASMTVRLHAAHVPRLKRVVRRLTSLLDQQVASRLVVVLTQKNVRLSHALLVNQ